MAAAMSSIFGAVLYEMATGKRAFDGKSQLSVASAILDRDPEPITTYQKTAPAVLEHVVQRALEKDPENRWQSVRDMKLELQWMLELPLHPASSVQTITRRRKQEPLLWISLCILALAGVFLWKTLQQPQPRMVRFTVAASEKSRFGYGIAISPDGSQLCFTVSTDGKTALALRALDSLETRPLSNTTGGDFPFWSPDGRALGFFADGKLKRIDLATGATQVLADAVDGRGGSWGREGDILFAPSTVGPLMRVRATGGSAAPATKAQNAISHRWPQFLPDGEHFLYLSSSNDNFGSLLEKVYYSVLGEPEAREITESSSGAQYASGHLLYIKGTTLLAQPFKAENGKVIGEPISVADGIRAEGEGGPSAFGNFTVSGNGVLVFNRAGMTRIRPTWFDLTGKRLQAIAAPGDYDEPALSPDGTRVVMDQNAESGERNIYVLDLARGTSTRVSLNVSKAASPIWSPDGKRVAFRGGSAGESGMYIMSASGAGAEELISKTDLEAYPDDWSADGKLLLFEVPSSATNSDLWLMPLIGERKAKPLLNSKYNETHASFSPNSHWIAYSSDESGRSEIYVQSFPDLKVKLQISTEGGDQAYWSRDGKKLFYLAPDRTLMFVKVSTGGNFQASSPSRLFQLSVHAGGIMESRSTYAIANDEKRILVMEVQQTATTEPVVVVNWTAALNK